MFFEEHQNIKSNSAVNRAKMDIASTFVANFSCGLQRLASHFCEKDIEKFIKGQLAAGKDNYSEDQFVQAFSEVMVLGFLTDFAGKKVVQATYEPKLQGQSNPEARIEYNDGVVFDVEVKTPCFPKIITIPKDKRGILKPNMVLTREQFSLAKELCQNANIEFMPPRVLKIKDFIKSASNKFEKVDNIEHFNILFINWTLSDFYNVGVNEPIGLIGNPINGIIHCSEAASQIGISDKDLENISAIVIYRDSFDSISQCDYRWHFAAPKRVELILNGSVQSEHVQNIAKKLNRDPMNTSFCEWAPFDWAFDKDEDEITIKTQADSLFRTMMKLSPQGANTFNFSV